MTIPQSQAETSKMCKMHRRSQSPQCGVQNVQLKCALPNATNEDGCRVQNARMKRGLPDALKETRIECPSAT